MSRNRLLLISVISLISGMTACGKSEVPADTTNSNSTQIAPPPSAQIDTPSPSNPTEHAPGTGTSLIESGMALAEKNNCLGCHTLDKKLVGPAWKDVAKRYKGMPGIEHTLIVKVSTGGAGNWGDMPMPAMAPAVKEEDIRALVRFVLSLEQ